MPATLSILDRDPPAGGRSRVGAPGVRRQGGEGPSQGPGSPVPLARTPGRKENPLPNSGSAPILPLLPKLSTYSSDTTFAEAAVSTRPTAGDAAASLPSARAPLEL